MNLKQTNSIFGSHEWDNTDGLAFLLNKKYIQFLAFSEVLPPGQ
jgi:hypothetical protein